jgi:Zn-dependent M28 family amino/carboxypeptidase
MNMKRWKSANAFGKRSSLICSLVVILLFLNSLPLTAQQGQSAPQNLYSPQLLKELKQIQEAALKSDYAYKQTAYLSNNIGPRLSGSRQAERAVEYVANELRRLGLEVKLEKLMVPHWVRGVETGELVEFPGQAPQTTQKIVLTALGGSVATPAAGLTAEVVVVNNFDELQALGRERVAGKIVLFNVKFDRQMAAQGYGGDAYGQVAGYRVTGASAAARQGAIASLVRSVGGSQNRLAHTGAMRYAQDAPRIPSAAVSSEDADLIAGLVKEGRVRLHLTMTPRQLPDAVSYNVVADLKGTDQPEQVVIVSGHLDSWDLGTGAIDDAAGVAVAMETAQLLKQLKLRPKRTIRVIAWMNEENGLVGGRTYATEHAAELANHYAAIESDRGAGHPLGFEARVHPDVLPMLAPVSEILRSQGAGLIRRTEGTEADISPMAAQGVPAFGLWQDTRTYFNYHHTAADTLDKIVPRELAENAAAMAVLAYALANLPQPLPRDPPPPRNGN